MDRNTVIIIVIAVALLLVCSYFVYMKFFKQSQGQRKAPRQVQHVQPIEDYDPVLQQENTDNTKEKKKLMSQYYKPRDVGPGTGEYRVFNTSKGLRVYEVSVPLKSSF